VYRPGKRLDNTPRRRIKEGDGSSKYNTVGDNPSCAKNKTLKVKKGVTSVSPTQKKNKTGLSLGANFSEKTARGPNQPSTTWASTRTCQGITENSCLSAHAGPPKNTNGPVSHFRTVTTTSSEGKDVKGHQEGGIPKKREEGHDASCVNKKTERHRNRSGQQRS